MIYFIACPEANAVKIGASAHPDRCIFSRLSAMQSGCPLKLELLAIAGGHLDEEAALHARFAADRIRGEWFRLTDEIRQHIAQFPRPQKPARGDFDPKRSMEPA